MIQRAAALLVGAALACGLALSPVGQQSVATLATAGATQQQLSIRQLNYALPGLRQQPASMYQKVLAGTPDSVTSLYVMGSSEFYVQIPQNAANWLPQYSSDFDMYLSGRGNQQSLYHAIELAAIASSLTEPKVVLIVSPQWFTPGGIKASQFQSQFSRDAWDTMLENTRLSAGTRQRLVDRTATLMPGLCSARARCATNPVGRAWEFASAPYSSVSHEFALLQETYQTEHSRRAFSYTGAWQSGSGPMDDVDWDAVDAEAARVGATRVTNNSFGMDDQNYTQFIAPYLSKLPGRQKNDRYTDSVEYDDLQLFLDVAKDLGVEVMLVALPVNGLWSDFTQLPTSERDGYAARIRAIATANDVQLTDLTGNQYEPFYFYDSIHIGWRGWVDVTRACWEFGRPT